MSSPSSPNPISNPSTLADLHSRFSHSTPEVLSVFQSMLSCPTMRHSRIKKTRSGLGEFIFCGIQEGSYDCDFFYDFETKIQFTLVKFTARAQGPPGGKTLLLVLLVLLVLPLVVLSSSYSCCSCSPHFFFFSSLHIYETTSGVHGGAITTIVDHCMAGLCVVNKLMGVTLSLALSFRSFIPIDTHVLVISRVSSQEDRKLYIESEVTEPSVWFLYHSPTSSSSPSSSSSSCSCSSSCTSCSRSSSSSRSSSPFSSTYSPALTHDKRVFLTAQGVFLNIEPRQVISKTSEVRNNILTSSL
jgi:hypothetical protein